MLGFGYRIFLCGFMGYIYLESRPGGRWGGFPFREISIILFLNSFSLNAGD